MRAAPLYRHSVDVEPYEKSLFLTATRENASCLQGLCHGSPHKTKTGYVRPKMARWKYLPLSIQGTLDSAGEVVLLRSLPSPRLVERGRLLLALDDDFVGFLVSASVSVDFKGLCQAVVVSVGAFREVIIAKAESYAQGLLVQERPTQ